MAERPSRVRALAARAWKPGLGAIGALVALVALAHLGPLRGALRAAGGCPVAKLDAAAHDRFRVEQQRGLAGEAAAPTHRVPALEMDLERTTKDDVRAWARAHGAACDEAHAGTALTCRGADGLVDVRDVFFRFDARGRLVAADLMHAPLAPQAGATLAAGAARALEGELGAPSSSHGELTASALSEPGAGAGLAYRFRDLAVDVTALHGEDGVIVRQQYRSVGR